MRYIIFKLALKNIFSNKKQSLLTMLGIIIGIASVITIISLGKGAESLITNQIKQIGTNLMAVIPGKSEDGGGPPPIARGIIITTLKEHDANLISQVHDVEGVVPIVLGNAVLSSDIENEAISYWGVGYLYPFIQEVELKEGRFFSEREQQNNAKVVVLGSEIRDKFFGDKSAIGKNIKIDKQNFKVVGVFDKQGNSFIFNQDNQVYIPYVTAQKILQGIDYLHVLRLKASNRDSIPFIQTQIEHILRKSHNIDDPKNDDFSIRTQEQSLNTLNTVTQGLTIFLAAIAGISLIVGGVGIMNMMLVLVTRRTREIGLRKAIGAKKSNIIIQFLIETVLITVFGGIIGILLGVLISFIISFIIQYLGYNWDFLISFISVVLAFSISIIVGIIFGLYPSIKAANLNPIEALRYE